MEEGTRHRRNAAEVGREVLEDREPKSSCALQRRRNWGKSWSPNYPTTQQLVQEADFLRRKFDEGADRPSRRRAARAACEQAFGDSPREATRAKASRFSSNGKAASSAEEGNSQETMPSEGTRRTPLRPRQDPRPEVSPARSQPPATPSRLDMTATLRSQSTATVLPATGPRRVRNNEPAKVIGPDGRIVLRGVRSTSDLKRYADGIDLHSRRGWEIRESFKAMRSTQHGAAAVSTW
eukprot:CAMPEP_0170602916 /NCGR_PEP_ID=MMETSP0224-20130122/18643_1 /TAXON_ID=285029 /ORGANISM="Togula jolla, Strain CCCM 725" /LENGTH=236 /DNA_ID=CAMNT_0010927781 /DNA_START=66 /DNA_END=773 /DNA_ORIENTATION=+